MGGIDLSRHEHEYLDVFLGERPGKACRVTQLQLAERVVFNTLHSEPPNPLVRRRAGVGIFECNHPNP